MGARGTAKGRIGRAVAAGVAVSGLFGGAAWMMTSTSADASVRNCSAEQSATDRPTLRLLDTGSCVQQAQAALRAHGITVGTDGSYGVDTQTAVERFQKDNGLPVNGRVDSATWAKLISDSAGGSSTASPTLKSTPSPSTSPSSSATTKPNAPTGGTFNQYTCGNNGQKVLLVFDDYSPSMSNYRALIDAAKTNNIGIGVAPNGNAVAAGQVDVNYARANGMLVIDHTWDHPDLTTLSNEQIKSQISHPEINSNYVRPPFGATNARVQEVFKQNGKYNCLWTLDPRDWDGKSPSAAAQFIIDNAKAGSTAVVHLNHMGTDAGTMAQIKNGLAARGLELCRPWSKPTTNKMPATYCD